MKRWLIVVFILACRNAKSNTHDAAMPACARVGQTCEVSPGKLGACVERDSCDAPPCFVCQSQH